jgi:hypothetical protein
VTDVWAPDDWYDGSESAYWFGRWLRTGETTRPWFTHTITDAAGGFLVPSGYLGLHPAKTMPKTSLIAASCPFGDVEPRRPSLLAGMKGRVFVVRERLADWLCPWD